MKLLLITIAIAIAWCIKVVVGYYVVAWLGIPKLLKRWTNAVRRKLGIPERTGPDFGKVFRALDFAAYKHRNQRRKDADATPYLNHLTKVLYLLWHVAGVRDIDVLCAGVLHDTIEDTHTTYEELVREFGKRVADMVLECTDDKSLPKAERKRLQIVNAKKKSEGARHIKLADKTANVGDLTELWSVERRLQYVDWAGNVVDEMRGTNAPLEALFDATAKEARDKLSS